jgi:tetratricopeptide (TPR) repeat protein
MHTRVKALGALAAVLTASILTLAASDETTAIQLQLGDLFYEQGRYSDALRAYERARLAEEPQDRVRAISGTVKAALRVAEFARAMTAATELKDSLPSSARAVALYGEALWATGLFERAEQEFQASLAIDPDLPEGHHGLARSLAARNRLPEALVQAETALRLATRDGEFHHTVGYINERLNRYEEAAAAFGNYLSLLPNRDKSDKAALARTKIRFLRSFGRTRPVQIDDDRPDMFHTVPFRLVRDKVMVRGVVNGRYQVEFVLDTGAEQTVLAERTAQRAGVAPVVPTLSAGVGEIGLRGLQLGRIASLQIGTLKVSDVPCLIKNPKLGGIPTTERDGFSPLALGLSMTIDYKRRQLVFGRRIPQAPAETELPLRLHRLALVSGQVNGDRTVNFIVDTGGEVISISEATAGSLGDVRGRRIPLKVYGISGWDRNAFLLPGINLQFADIQYRNFPVVVLNMKAPSALLGFQVGGIVGHRFLSQYRVDIDVDQAVVRLHRESPVKTE